MLTELKSFDIQQNLSPPVPSAITLCPLDFCRSIVFFGGEGGHFCDIPRSSVSYFVDTTYIPSVNVSQ